MQSPSDPDIASPTFNFSEALRHGKLNRRQGLMLLMLGLLVMVDGMDAQMLAVIARSIMHDLNLPISVFGLVYSTGLLGGALGLIVMSTAADRLFGPKCVTIAAMTLAGLATLLTPAVSNLTELLAIRLVTGFALGAAIPGIFALAAEFAPKQVSRPVTSSLIACTPLGSFLGGMLGRVMVPDYGWPALLYVGGGLTLLVALLAVWLLPESIHFSLQVKNDGVRALAAATRLYGPLATDRVIVDHVDVVEVRKSPVARLFSPDLWRFTILVWISGILSSALIYFIMSWTPTLLEKSGSVSAAGMNAAAMFGIGGAVGTILQGWLTKTFNIYRVMLVEMGISVVAMTSMPLIIYDPVLAPVAIFVLSAAICAYQTGFVLIVIEAYPSDIRSTGFGWSYGINRIGATSAPVVTGLLIALGWTPGQLFVGAALPGLISALALIGVGMLLRKRELGADAQSQPA